MPASHLWRISVKIFPEAEDAVSTLLERSTGGMPSVYTDAKTRVSVASVYCKKLPGDLKSLREALKNGLRQTGACGLDIGPGETTIRKILRENWAESWKRHFKPLEIDPRLLVKPGWSHRKPRKGQAVVLLDPGLSFGTGQHPTTAFCLKQLAVCRRDENSQSFLDVGTGSGILAIAAAKLGYHPAHAFDSDSSAIRVARANAARNRVQRQIRFCVQDLQRLPGRSSAKFDMICANLTADLLLGSLTQIVNRLESGGTLVLAGVLGIQYPAIEEACIQAGLKEVCSRMEGEWRSGAFTLEG